MRDTLHAGLTGAVAGAIATAPMSAVMLAAERTGLLGRQPPEAIVQRALDAANAKPRSAAVRAAAVTTHFAFGAAGGAAYAFLDNEDDSLPLAVAKGVGFGLAMYAVSYAGWIPAMHILPKPARDRKGRQPSIAVAHVVYGAALALLMRHSRSFK
jgi:hypothetical protein